MKLTDKLALTEAHFDLHEVRMSYCLVASLRPFNLQTFPKKGCCNSITYSAFESYSRIQSSYSYSSCHLLKDSAYRNLPYSDLICLRWTRQTVWLEMSVSRITVSWQQGSNSFSPNVGQNDRQ